MDKSSPTTIVAEATAKAPSVAPSDEKQIQSIKPSSNNNGADEPTTTLSKNQLKKRRRYEKSQAIKKRRKEQEREIKRIKAQNEGRDLDAERQQQLQNQKSGQGWMKRESKWKDILSKAQIDSSFRVCFDCTFEDQMVSKECNSLSLQLRYVYSMNRKSSMPVYIDVCGLNKECLTYKGLEKVEGFPDSWVGRAFHCYQQRFEEVYANSIESSNGDGKNCEGKSEEEDGQEVLMSSKASSGNEITTHAKSPKKNDSNDDNTTNKESRLREPSYPKLTHRHKFVYLTGDSPNTLTTLDNNTTYIIGGIVDRNRLKRAAIDRAESIRKQYPTLDITTARLPLDENVDFKASTRILTCNHVFEILQKYRENGYTDWKSSIMKVLPGRKELEEKKRVVVDDIGKEDKGEDY